MDEPIITTDHAAEFTDTRVVNGVLELKVDLQVISERALLAAIHRLSGRMDVSIHAENKTVRKLTVRPRNKMSNLQEVAWELNTAFIDESLRQIIRAETAPIRAVLIAQAFSKTNLLHPELDAEDPGEDRLNISTPDRLKPEQVP